MDLVGCLISQSVSQSVMYLQQLREQDMTQRHHMKLAVQKKTVLDPPLHLHLLHFSRNRTQSECWQRAPGTDPKQNAPTTTANQTLQLPAL